MKLAYGTAGTNVPSDPCASVEYVRVEANVTMLGRPLTAELDTDDAELVKGRISSDPAAPCAEAPAPNQLSRTSSSATVRPGSMSIVVCLPAATPVSPD